MLTLPTDRLLLRDFRADDFDAFYATTEDDAYRRFYPIAETTRPFWQAIFTRIRDAAAEPARRVFQLAVCLRDGTLIGTVGVRVEDPVQRQASFGCAIGRPHWGQGYALEASRALIDYGFTQLPVERLYAETNAENGAARTLAQRLGMRHEGTFIHHRYFRDRWWDTAVYAILRHEWPAAD